MKEYGQDLNKRLKDAELALSNVHNKIEKRFGLIVDKYHQYLSEEEMTYIQSVGYNDLTEEKKLEIMMSVEKRYVDDNSNQLSMFN